MKKTANVITVHIQLGYTVHNMNKLTVVCLRLSFGGTFSFVFQPWSSLPKHKTTFVSPLHISQFKKKTKNNFMLHQATTNHM